ncbi:MAG: COP23 domain-containing protein [Cyanobacteria bacterium P01_D01_bin.2]
MTGSSYSQETGEAASPMGSLTATKVTPETTSPETVMPETDAITDYPPPTTSPTPEPLAFSCQLDEGTPTTMAQMPEGVIPIVRWDSPAIAVETTQQADCEASAQRFQAAYSAGTLSYITTGRIEGQLVVCAAGAIGDRCLNRLLDLQATPRPRVALQQVLQIRLPTEGPISDTGPRPYVSLSRYLSGDYR